MVKEYTDDEIKVLYALDPYGVADYVLRYSEYLAQTDSENDTIEKRVIAAMLEKDRCFKVIFGQDAKHYKRESNGRWYLDKYPENLAEKGRNHTEEHCVIKDFAPLFVLKANLCNAALHLLCKKGSKAEAKCD